MYVSREELRELMLLLLLLLDEASEAAWAFSSRALDILKTTFSRKSTMLGSWVSRPSIMRSPSCPMIQCRRFGSYSNCSRCSLRNCMILCSPSPGTLGPLKMIVSFFHFGSVESLCLTKCSRCCVNSAKKGVPGVISFE